MGMPGMNNLENMFSKMSIPGLPKGAKIDMNAFNKHMEHNMRSAKMRDRMRAKLDEKNKSESSEAKHLITSLGLASDGMEQLIYSTGESIDKSNRPQKKKKNRG